MTEIPKRKEGQTWINYLIETMNEKGLGLSLELESFKTGEDPETIECHFTGYYTCKYGNHIGKHGNLSVELRYTRNTEDGQDWGDFNKLDYLPYWQMITFPESSILFDKLPGSEEYIDLELGIESIEGVLKGIRSKVKDNLEFVAFGMNDEQMEREINSEDFNEDIQYIITDISVGEELLYKLVDYIVQRNKGEAE